MPDPALQLARLRLARGWDAPLAVVAEDRPTAPLLAVGASARRAGLQQGMSLAAARAVLPSLVACVVERHRVEALHEELAAALRLFSPRVEPVVFPTLGPHGARLPCAFHLDPRGFEKSYGGPASWARLVHSYLTGRGLHGALVVGFGRFATVATALAHGRGEPRLLGEPCSQRRALEAVPLSCMAPLLDRDALQALDELGIRTIGQLLALPADEVRARLGSTAAALHALACADLPLPLQGHPPDEPIVESGEIDPPDDDRTRLLFAAKRALDRALARTARRAHAVCAVELTLALDAPRRLATRRLVLRIAPAEPTLDVTLLCDLLRLRLEAAQLPAPVARLELSVETTARRAEQLELPAMRASRRDLHALDRALARVRAAFGPRSVARARLREAHLPEAGFALEPFDQKPRAPLARVEAHETAPLPPVRRLWPKALPLPPRDPDAPERGPRLQSPARLHGPCRLSGGWWVRHVERDYYWAETTDGLLLWVYYDRPRRRWFLHAVAD
ncbi:MAG: DNA polymerase Y family protein [Myxococcota bacterium]|nr:DNA polymerase Y family protein [Myxococcota bacterium]